MRRLAIVPIVALLSLVFAAPTLAAKPTIISFEDDDAADSAIFSAACGFAVTAESSGHVVIHNPKSGAATEIFNWNINTWLYSENGSYHLVDAGPDMLLTKAGTSYFTVTGRSVTFSSVVGRVEVNLDTDDVTYHGNLIGDEVFDPSWFAPICEALSPG
ncbi:MAG TPA: hypothetical protein VEX41_01740 [Candidatus Eisenbacteria bacterium]|nr:hypothetical protein [Candidatus Eisenbacteria bacterium]